MSYFRKIVGKKLYLSPVCPDSDAEKYIKWMNDKDVAINFNQYNCVVASKNDLKWLYETPADMQRYAIVLLDGGSIDRFD